MKIVDLVVDEKWRKGAAFWKSDTKGIETALVAWNKVSSMFWIFILRNSEKLLTKQLAMRELMKNGLFEIVIEKI